MCCFPACWGGWGGRKCIHTQRSAGRGAKPHPGGDPTAPPPPFPHLLLREEPRRAREAAALRLRCGAGGGRGGSAGGSHQLHHVVGEHRAVRDPRRRLRGGVGGGAAPGTPPQPRVGRGEGGGGRWGAALSGRAGPQRPFGGRGGLGGCGAEPRSLGGPLPPLQRPPPGRFAPPPLAGLCGGRGEGEAVLGVTHCRQELLRGGRRGGHNRPSTATTPPTPLSPPRSPRLPDRRHRRSAAGGRTPAGRGGRQGPS